MKIHFCLDSGAYSLYSEKIVGRDKEGRITLRGSANDRKRYDFFDSDEFKEYLERYIFYCTRYKHFFDFYVTVDAIANAAKTQETLAYLMSKGLNPIPVFHYGSDISVLKKYASNHEHIGIGGLAKSSIRDYVIHADGAFKYLVDAKGRCSVKVHGFAMTSFRLMERYPWYTVDSTSAGTFSRYGFLCLPKIYKSNGKQTYDYFANTRVLVSDRMERLNAHKMHLNHFPTTVRREVIEFLEQFGLTFQECQEDYLARELVNHYFVDRLQQLLGEKRGYPGPYIYRSGKMAFAPSRVPEFMTRFAAMGVKDFWYMGTMYRPEGLRAFNSCFGQEVFESRRQLDKEMRNGHRQTKASVDFSVRQPAVAGARPRLNSLSISERPRISLR